MMDTHMIKQQAAIFVRKSNSFFRRIAGRLSSLRFGYQIGLVVHERSIHLSLVRRLFFRTRILGTYEYALDDSAVRDWASLVDAAVSILVDFKRKHSVRRAPINIGLLGEDIAFRRLYLPMMSTSELVSAIRWEGDKLFPFPFEQSIVNSSVEAPERTGSSYRLPIHIVAARNAIIEILYDRFGAANLRLGQVGFLPEMLVSAAPHLGLSLSTESTLLLYLGNSYCLAMFTRDGVLEFFQQFVTQAVPDIENGKRMANANAIMAELVSFIDLYDGHSRGRPLERIVVCGPYADDSAAVEAIGTGVGLPCQSWPDPGARTASGESEPDVLAVGVSSPSLTVLAPSAIRDSARRRALAFRLGTVAFLILLATVTLHLRMAGRLETTKNTLAAKQAISDMYDRSPGYQAYVHMLNRIQAGHRYLQSTSEGSGSIFHIVLKEMSLSLPDYITLTALTLEEDGDGHELIVEGYVRIEEFSPEIVLAEYVETLGALPFFSGVTVSHHQKNPDRTDDDLTFQLTMDAQV